MYKEQFSPRGKLMPQTPEQYAYMAQLFEEAMLSRDAEISNLKQKVNTLEQKLKSLRTGPSREWT